MGKHYSYTDQYLGCALALLRSCIGTPAASSHFFFRCHERRILQDILRDIEEICAGVHGHFLIVVGRGDKYFFSKQEEKRKVCVNETSRKWVGEAVVMSCCLWQ